MMCIIYFRRLKISFDVIHLGSKSIYGSKLNCNVESRDMKYYTDPIKKTNWWTYPTFVFFTTFHWKLNRKPASVLKETQIETFFCHKTDTGLHLWRQIREIGAENKNIARVQWCRAFTFPILLQGQVSGKDKDEKQYLVKTKH